MCHRGKGAPVDFVYADAWWNIAAARAHGFAAEGTREIRKRMTVEQIAEARQLSRKLAAKTRFARLLYVIDD